MNRTPTNYANAHICSELIPPQENIPKNTILSNLPHQAYKDSREDKTVFVSK